MSISVPPKGWYVEVDAPGGNTLQLDVGDDAEARPTLNGRPEVVIPVTDADHWTESDWELQPMRVWLDGNRLPIGRVAEVREQPGGVELVGRPGKELLEEFTNEYTDANAHEVIRDILDGTTYARDVDAAESSENDLIATWKTTSAFQDNEHPDQEPAPVIDNDQVEPPQTGYLTAPQNIDSNKVTGLTSENWTASEAVEINVANEEQVSWTITLDADIAGNNLGVWWRWSDNYDGFARVTVDGTKVGDFARTNAGDSDKAVEWADATNIGSARTASSKPDLSAGDITITINTTKDNSETSQTLGPDGELYLDTFIVFDTRFWTGSNFVNSLDSNNLLDGGPPGLYAPVDIDFLVKPVLRSTGGRLEASLTSTANGQALGVATDTNSSFTTAANDDTLEADFGDDVGAWVARGTLGGIDDTDDATDVESSVTKHRTEPQALTELTLKHDEFRSPTIDRPIRGQGEDLLTELANQANLLWEVQYDETADSITVVVTAVGQRSTDADPDLLDYEVRKDSEAEISQARIIGKTERVVEETFEADPGGTDLQFDNIDRGSERVYDPDTGDEFDRGDDEDYTMEYLNGRINAGDAQSDMVDGDSYQIDYSERAVETQAQVGAGATIVNEVVREIPQLTTDAECQQAARFIVDNADTPQFQATVRIPRQELGFDLVDVIDPSQLPSPGGNGYETRGIDETASEIQLRLGGRLSINELVSQIRASIGQTAREV